MKPLRETIRQYIRTILIEAMTSPNSLGDDFAVWTNWYEETSPPPGTELNFILYNAVGAGNREPLMNAIDGIGLGIDDYEVVEAIGSQIYAVIRARVPDSGYGECNSAWEVIRSAADKGYGPTLYDLVMSISPNGLTSDRSEVSAAAKKVWSHYANNRSGVDLRLLDPDGNFTVTEEDDCTMKGSGNVWEVSPLPALHRQMAIDFFEDDYSVEHEEWMEDQDPQHLEYLRHVDGDKYFEEVTKWIAGKQEDGEFEEWDFDDVENWWQEWKMENEPNLIDNVEGKIPDPQQLNISYNTDYAESVMNDLIGNHSNWISKLEDDIDDLEISLDEELLNFAVRDFFNEKYS